MSRPNENTLDHINEFTALESDDNQLQGEAVILYYIPLQQAKLWPDNSKKHDIGAIIESIESYGFRDPPTYDAQLEALVEGNGRTEALDIMRRQEHEVPRGILINKETGDWCIPVLFGIDATSQAMAQRYAIDHNNITMLGGDLTVFDIEKMWDRDKYISILQDLSDNDRLPVSVDPEDLQLLLESMEEDVELEDPGAQMDRADELQQKWNVQPGDLWLIPSKTIKYRKGMQNGYVWCDNCSSWHKVV